MIVVDGKVVPGVSPMGLPMPPLPVKPVEPEEELEPEVRVSPMGLPPPVPPPPPLIAPPMGPPRALKVIPPAEITGISELVVYEELKRGVPVSETWERLMERIPAEEEPAPPPPRWRLPYELVGLPSRAGVKAIMVPPPPVVSPMGLPPPPVPVVSPEKALEVIEPYEVKPEISEQFVHEELKRGVPIGETLAKIEAMPPVGYDIVGALKAGVPVSTLESAGFGAEDIKVAAAIAYAPPVTVGVGEYAGFEAAGEYVRGTRAPGYVPTVEEYRAAHPEMTSGELVGSYEEQFGDIKRSTTFLGITKYPGGSSKWEYENVPTGLREEVKREVYPEAPLSIEGFTAQFVAGLERPRGAGREWEEAMGTVARRKYREIYGVGAVVTGIPSSLAAMATPPGRVFFPEVTIGEITWPEWTIMGAQAAMITAPYWVPPAWRVLTKVPGFRRFAPAPPPPAPVYAPVTEPYGFPGVAKPTIRGAPYVPDGLGRVSPLAPRFYEVFPGPPPLVPYTGVPAPALGGIRAPISLVSGKLMEIPIRPAGLWAPFFRGPTIPTMVAPVVGVTPTAVAPPTTLTMTPEQLAKLLGPLPITRAVGVPVPLPRLTPFVPFPKPVVVPVVRPVPAPIIEPLPGVPAVPTPIPTPIPVPVPVVPPVPALVPPPVPVPIVTPVPGAVPLTYPWFAPVPAPEPIPTPTPAPIPFVPAPVPVPRLVVPTEEPRISIPAPPVPLPFWLPAVPSLKRLRARDVRRRLLKGPLGRWISPGMLVTAPHPLFERIAGGVVARREIKYAAVKPRVGITGPTRITGSDVGYGGRAYVPATGV